MQFTRIILENLALKIKLASYFLLLILFAKISTVKSKVDQLELTG